MTDKLIEQIKRDREAGTPGPWTWETESGEWSDHVLVDANGDSVMWFDLDLGFRFASEGVKRLIARIPELDALVRADERAKVIEEVKALCVGFRWETDNGWKKGANARMAFLFNEIDAIHTDASRAITKGGAE